MSNWEEKYNEINPKIDSMIAEQVVKMNEARRKQAELGKDVDSQEYKQAKADLKTAKTQKENLDKIKPNLKKVSNYIAIRKQIEARLNEYSKVRNCQNEIINNRRQIGKCEQLEKEATEDLKKLTDKLRNGNLSESEKSEVNRQITEATNKKQNAFNLRNQLNGKNKSLNEGLKDLKYGEVDRNTVKEKMAEERKAIEILDLKCEQLMNGEHVDYIYQQVISKKEKSSELEQPETTEKKQNDRVNDDDFQLKGKANKPRTDGAEYEESSSKNTFADKHPRLAKIGNFFKNIKDKILNRNKTPELEEGTENKYKGKFEGTEVEEEVKRNVKEIMEKKEQAHGIKFTDKEMDRLIQDLINSDKSLDEAGEKGIKSLRDSVRVTLSKEAEARLAKFRADNGYGPKSDEKVVFSQKGRDAMKAMYGPVPEVQKKGDDGREPGDD